MVYIKGKKECYRKMSKEEMGDSLKSLSKLRKELRRLAKINVKSWMVCIKIGTREGKTICTKYI